MLLAGQLSWVEKVVTEENRLKSCKYNNYNKQQQLSGSGGSEVGRSVHGYEVSDACKWTEGLELMKTSQKFKGLLVIPYVHTVNTSDDDLTATGMA